MTLRQEVRVTGVILLQVRLIMDVVLLHKVIVTRCYTVSYGHPE